MASFSFGTGNLAKLVRIPLYVAGRIATLVIPRGSTWVFGCGAGIGDGALALWSVASAAGVDAVWLVDNERDASDASARGIPTVKKMSVRGFWLTARARVLVVTHGFGDVNRYANGGAFIAQLWHGIPLKRIGLDSPETVRLPIGKNSALLQSLMARLYRGTTSHISVIPAASHMVRGRLESAFSLPDERVIVTGEPRVDPLNAGEPRERLQRARAILTAAVGELPHNIVIYAPTWRDGASDAAIPTEAHWSALIEVLERHDAVLLIRSHPLGSGLYTPPASSNRVRMIGSDIVRDVTPVMPAMTALVTDYSSMLFDAGLVPAPVLFLAPDAEEYARTRGFYGQYSDVAGNDYATSWEELTVHLDEMLADEAVAKERTERAQKLSLRVHDFRDGQNTQRVYGEIQRRLNSVPSKGSP